MVGRGVLVRSVVVVPPSLLFPVENYFTHYRGDAFFSSDLYNDETSTEQQAAAAATAAG